MAPLETELEQSLRTLVSELFSSGLPDSSSEILLLIFDFLSVIDRLDLMPAPYHQKVVGLINEPVFPIH